MKGNKTAKAPIAWLLETDNVGVRYLAMRDLITVDKKELTAAKKLAHTEGTIAQVLAMLAFSKLPERKRTALINKEIDTGVDFLFSTDPAKADYHCGYSAKPSGNWWKFRLPRLLCDRPAAECRGAGGVGLRQ